MHEQIIASECLKNWWDRGLIVQQPYTPEDNGSDECQVEDERNRSRNRGGGYRQHVLVGGSKVLVVGSTFSWEATGAREVAGS
jgi:hypothetical protein